MLFRSGVGDGGVAVDVTKKFVGSVAIDPVDAIFRIPVTFLICDDKSAVRIETDSVCSTEAGGKDVGLRAVGRDSEEGAVMRDERVFGVAGGLGVVEISLIIGLEAHRKFVEVLGDLMVIVEALDVIDSFVSIGVVKFCELITAGDMDFVLYDL